MNEKPLAVSVASNRYDGIIRLMELLEDSISLSDGNRILIKPNLVASSNFKANTNYRSVFALINFLKENFENLEIVVGEGSAEAWKKGKTTIDIMREMMYFKIQERHRDVIFRDLLEESMYEELEVEMVDGKGNVGVSSFYREFDYIISLALPKTHDFAITTLSIKNMMGLMRNGDWIKMHGIEKEDILYRKKFFGKIRDDEIYLKCIKVIHRNIVRLLKEYPPSLSIIDGFTGIQGDGPVNGEEIKLGIFTASEDPVKADALISSAMGFNPEDIGYLYLAHREGIGSIEINEYIGDNYRHRVKKFKPHSDYDLQIKWKEGL